MHKEALPAGISSAQGVRAGALAALSEAGWLQSKSTPISMFLSFSGKCGMGWEGLGLAQGLQAKEGH